MHFNISKAKRQFNKSQFFSIPWNPWHCVKRILKQNAIICRQTVFTKCPQALAVISLIQSCVSQRTLPYHCLWTTVIITCKMFFFFCLSSFYDLLLHHSCQNSGFTDWLLNRNVIKMRVQCQREAQMVKLRLPMVSCYQCWARQLFLHGKTGC